ncbi:MAG: DUF4160 domain-containing protein [Tannerella sp.]|jgi:hypothetical protein|nr:DUF4160 domain-containing protein [Tannerella sp.]
MPTILNLFGLRFFFYLKDHEPVHIHVENGDGEAKFEIETDLKLVYNHGLKQKDIRLAESIIEENKENFINEWKKRFDDGNNNR